MSTNPQQSQLSAHHSELIYRLEDRPPLPQTLFAACQHLLAMFVAVITPALLICQALGLPAQDTQHIISMSLFASGVASILQIKTWGPVGSGLLSIQGTSFNFVTPLIMGGMALKNGGADVPTMMAALFGTLMIASCTEMVLSRVLHLARRIITPLVSGIVVMIIGLSLIQVGLTSIGGGFAAMNDHSFGAPKNLLLAGAVLLVIILLNRQKILTCGWLRWLLRWRQVICLPGRLICCPKPLHQAISRWLPCLLRSITALALTGIC